MNGKKNMFHGKRKSLWILIFFFFIVSIASGLVRGISSLTTVLQISYDQFLVL